jgi:cytochrome c biogenesis protein CcmG/thiol:disulfide interchange protein DsbE
VVLAAGLGLGLTVTDGGAGARVAPSFVLPRLGGGVPVSMPVPGHRGAPVVVTFFASWCTPCQIELPMIARVARREIAGGGPVAFVGVDGNDDPASGLAFARSSGVAFPVAADAGSSVAPRYALVGYPDTVFVDATGRIAGTVHGAVTETVLHGWLARLSGH